MRITRSTASAVLALCLLAGSGLTAEATPVPQLPAQFAPATDQAAAAASYGKLPLAFEVNAGQADPAVKFLSRGADRSVFLTATEAVLALRGAGEAVRFRLEGANPTPAVSGLDQLPGVANYLGGADRSKWLSDVPTFARVRYEGVYPGIDVDWYGRNGRLEHDYLLAPGADPSVINVAYDGARKLSLNAAGDLVIETASGEAVTQLAPVVYQEFGGLRQSVSGAYRLIDATHVGFTIGAHIPALPLVIDPVLDWSTHLGGNGAASDDFDSARGIAVDGSGAAYIVGYTRASNFPTTPGVVQEDFAGGGTCEFFADCGTDAFVTKLDPSGSAVVYSTYLGGSHDEGGFTEDFGDTDDPTNLFGIAVDGTGSAFVTGLTHSADYPTTAGAYLHGADLCSADPAAPCANAFLTKLDPTGGELAYSTLFGGTGFDAAHDLALDGQGAAYLTGRTESSDLPVTDGAHRTAPASAFVAKLDTAAAGAAALVYSTYLDAVDGRGIAVDEAGNAYVTGEARDLTTTPGAFQEANAGDADAFVAKLNAAGTALVYSTYLGGAAADNSVLDGDIAIDAAGAAYVTGHTSSADFPITPDALQPTFSGDEFNPVAFVSKLHLDGSALAYSTYLDGTGSGSAIAVDGSGSAYVTGTTSSGDDLLLRHAFQTGSGGGFVAKLNSSGSDLVYSTYLGIDRETMGGIAVRGAEAYVTGSTDSRDFPTKNPIQGSAILGARDADAFVTRFDATGGGLVYSTTLGNTPGGDAGLDIAVDRTGAAYIVGSTGSPDFPASDGSFQPGPSGGLEAFLTKLDPTGTSVVSSTYLGGRGDDRGLGIALDDAGNVYVTGATGSPDFPISVAASQSSHAGLRDAFVAKFDPNLGLAYSTYLGGRRSDQGVSIAADPTGAAYITGFTFSVDFPTKRAIQPRNNEASQEVFVTRLDPAGAISYSTYYGGPQGDEGTAIEVDGTGAAYVGGATSSSDFPTTPGAFQPQVNGGGNGFLLKIAPIGTAVEYATALGGSFNDFVIEHGLAIPAGCPSRCEAYVTGLSQSNDFPLRNPIQGHPPVLFPGDAFQDVFVTKVNATGTDLVYSTLLGGRSDDLAMAIAVDRSGAAYVTGFTFSGSTFPTLNPIAPPTDGATDDAFVTKISPSGDAIVYSTLVGGDDSDRALGIAVDDSGAAYVTGRTASSDFPTTPGGFQPIRNEGIDAFVLKISAPTGVFVDILDDADPVGAGQEVTYSVVVGNAGPDNPVSGLLEVDLPAAPTGVSDAGCTTASTTVTCPVTGLAVNGTYRLNVTVIAPDPGGTQASAEISFGLPGDDPADNVTLEETEVVALEADLSLSMFLADTADIGEPVQYFLDVTNNGEIAATDVVVTDTLPDAVTLVAAVPSQGACDGATCHLGRLGSGEAASIQITATVDDIGPLVNTATVTAAVPDPDDTNNTATAETVVDSIPALPPGLTLEGTGPLAAIDGALEHGGDVDLFRICVTGDAFSATTVGLTDVDTRLMLFRDHGQGLAIGKVANDDVADGVGQSTLPPGPTTYSNGALLTYEPGPYLLAIASAGTNPLDGVGNAIFGGEFVDVAAPISTGPLARWERFGFSGVSYRIALTGATYLGQGPCG